MPSTEKRVETEQTFIASQVSEDQGELVANRQFQGATGEILWSDAPQIHVLSDELPSGLYLRGCEQHPARAAAAICNGFFLGC